MGNYRKLSDDLPALERHPGTKVNRFHVCDDGTHEHRLYDGQRQDGLLEMLQDRLKAMKEEDQQPAPPQTISETTAEPLPPTTPPSQQSTTKAAISLIERYGSYKSQIGRGSSGIVRVTFKPHSEGYPMGRLFAVKKFEIRARESTKKYLKRLGAEFCISSTLRHPNVIATLDLIRDTDGNFCEIMEYCCGGDVYARVHSAGKLATAEANCYFKQLMRGLEYLHQTGVAHRDLKPDNLVLTRKGALKIADFGNAECFRLPWETKTHLTTGLCGSFPYISPEQYTDGEYFDARAVDIWAAGLVYMDMRTGRHLWRFAVINRDTDYREYVRDRTEAGIYEPIEALSGVSRIAYSATISL
jgi:protein-serine/threonine kinase